MDIPKEFGGRFLVEAQIADRPSCVVYKATDRQQNGKVVALKVFVDRPGDNQAQSQALKDEVTKYQSVKHPVFVPILDAGVEDGWFYIAMEFAPGTTLRSVLKESNGPLPVDRAVKIVTAVLEGLRALHQQKVWHGHIDSRALLVDGDAVRLVGYYPPTVTKIQKGMTSEGRLLVDPNYIAPEQVTGADSLDYRVDIYAVSALLYETVTGEKAFSTKNPLQTALLRLSQPAPSPRKVRGDLSPLLDAAIVKGLGRAPSDRFQSVDEMLDAISGGKGSAAPQKNVGGGSAETGDVPGRIGTETIGVSMSADDIKRMLVTHEQQQKKQVVGTAVESTGSFKAEKSGSAPSGSDMGQTMMGAHAAVGLKGSFVVVSPKNRGSRYSLDKSQNIIGSSDACDIYFTGKDIPARYAIVVNRGGEYYVGSLSKSGVLVNNEEIEGDEVLLRRGDVLNVGENRLRFVAPGEVFTLHDDVADRTIDRPEGKRTKVIISFLVILVMICGGAVYMLLEGKKSAEEKERLAKAQKDKKREQVIAQLRQEGDELFKAGQLIEPVGENAQERFRSILDLNPEDTYAKQRLTEISDRAARSVEEYRKRQQMAGRLEELLRDGDRYFNLADYVSPPGRNAKEAYEEVLRMDPENKMAKARISEINQILGDMLGQVEVLLARAQVFIDLGQFIDPPGENAFQELQKVLKTNPNHEIAKSALLDMAAESVFAGDQAKIDGKLKIMRHAYTTASALGVSPSYIEPRLAGAKLIEISKANVIIYDRPDAKGGKGEERKAEEGSQYLDTVEIEKRLSMLKARAESSPGDQGRIFIDLAVKDDR